MYDLITSARIGFFVHTPKYIRLRLWGRAVWFDPPWDTLEHVAVVALGRHIVAVCQPRIISLVVVL
jgi:hypothetical protein